MTLKYSVVTYDIDICPSDNLGLQTTDEHHSECPVIVLLSKKENHTRNSKRTLTGLMRAYRTAFKEIVVSHRKNKLPTK